MKKPSNALLSSQKRDKYLIHFMRLIFLFMFFFSSINAQITDIIHVERGWNLLSLPVKIDSTPINVTFMSAVSEAFLYQDGYMHRDTITNGMGFWLKFDSAETFILSGEPIHKDTINMNTGWNMIGTLSVPIPKSFITTDPDGIIISDYFYYDTQSGYQASDTLKPGLGYWIKVNQNGSIILSSMDIPCPGTPSIEYEGKIYNTVQIGHQCWLKENLDVGVMIQGSDTAKDNGTIEKYCYDNDVSNCDTYGGLYQWPEAMQYTNAEGAQGICPAGWHVPTLAEFRTLRATVDSSGVALKAIGQGEGAGVGTNVSGFSALIAGARGSFGPFNNLGYCAYFWTSTQSYSVSAYHINLFGYETQINPYNYWGAKENGFSIRCIKD
jgi:uncharacterized protein (TIGR02145 family)